MVEKTGGCGKQISVALGPSTVRAAGNNACGTPDSSARGAKGTAVLGPQVA